jgi:GT2 family glycosyltransferase/2-polyprenyl-3-methyl-5-hydroxy-6-metoxy-1,4-benzoquinol methylase
MHESSFHTMSRFRNLVEKHFSGNRVSVLDVGSYGVNGTYRDIFSDDTMFEYRGLDLQPGPNVDYVPKDPYAWEELEPECFDVIISGQAFEHIEFPWLIMEEITRILKKNGLACLIAPSRGPEHKYPVDCYRYYPDGFQALAKWAGLQVLEAKTSWGASGFTDGSDQWGDTFCILYKGDGVQKETRFRPVRPAVHQAPNRNNPLNSGKNVSYYSIERKDVIDAILKHSIRAKRVLEIGCAGGDTGKALKEALKTEYYAGVEISEEAAESASKHLDKVIVADIEATGLKDCGLDGEPFDMILSLDVLEHLYNPWDTLAGLKDHLREGGYLVASIPNVQNVTVITDLIKGRWRYTDAGLLDATHLRFFTLDETLAMFAGAGLTVESVHHVLNPAIDAGSLGAKGNNLSYDVLNIANLSKEEMLKFFSYQYIVLAKKGSNGHDGARPAPQESPDPAMGRLEWASLAQTTGGSKADAARLAFDKDLASIVIPVKDNWPYTKACLESIVRFTDVPFEVIIADNGSQETMGEYLKKWHGRNRKVALRYVRSGTNLGFGGACNRGITASSGNYIVILNNDTLVTSGWIQGMLAPLKMDNKIGITGPMSNFVFGPQVVPDCPLRFESPDGVDFGRLAAYSGDFRQRRADMYALPSFVIGLCMAMPRELVETIGGFDERFYPGNFEDDDLCIRARIAGYKLLLTGHVFIYHFGTRTFLKEGFDFNKTMKENLDRFMEKWGVRDVFSKDELYRKVLSVGSYPEGVLFSPINRDGVSLVHVYDERCTPEVLSYFSRYPHNREIPLILVCGGREARYVKDKMEEALRRIGCDDPGEITLYAGELTEVLNGLEGEKYLLYSWKQNIAAGEQGSEFVIRV